MEYPVKIFGERPAELPNPSSHEEFRSWRPSLFAPLQTEAYIRIKEGRSCALVGPTSSGKTLAVAAPLFESSRPAVFVLPFRSLILDQSHELVRIASVFGINEERFGRIWGGTSRKEIADALERDYILMTPDKLLSLFISGRDGNAAALHILSRYDFVFDEIHVFNSMMLTSLKYFLRSVQYWQESRPQKSGFYFLSATFPEEIWQMLKEEIGLQESDRIEGISFTGDIDLVVKPFKTVEKDPNGEVLIARDIMEYGIERNLVGIFNTAYRAWTVCEAISGLLFIGQDKMSEIRRRSNFEQFMEDPDLSALIGSPAIEAGVDFVARNLVIEESDQNSFVQRFGRAARSGQDAFLLVYSDTLYKMAREDQLKQEYKRQEFLAFLRQCIPKHEPRRLYKGLASYAYYNFWNESPEFLMESEDRALCEKLAQKSVDRLLAFRGLTPYTRYESGETISFKSLFLRSLPVDRGKVRGAPHPAKYFNSPRRKSPIIAKVLSIADYEDLETSRVMLAKVTFKNLDLPLSYWTLFEIIPSTATALCDDNIRLELNGRILGRHSDGSVGNTLIRFYSVDE